MLVVFVASQAFAIGLRSEDPGLRPLSVILQWIAIACGFALFAYTVFLRFYGRPLRALEAARRHGEQAWLFSPTAETRAALASLSKGAIDRVPFVMMLELKSAAVLVRAPAERGPNLVIPVGAIERVEIGQTFNVTTANECLVLVISTGRGAEPVRLPLLLQRETAPRIFTMGGPALQDAQNALHAFVTQART